MEISEVCLSWNYRIIKYVLSDDVLAEDMSDVLAEDMSLLEDLCFISTNLVFKFNIRELPII